jgi:hypothetical protein
LELEAYLYHDLGVAMAARASTFDGRSPNRLEISRIMPIILLPHSVICTAIFSAREQLKKDVEACAQASCLVTEPHATGALQKATACLKLFLQAALAVPQTPPLSTLARSRDSQWMSSGRCRRSPGKPRCGISGSALRTISDSCAGPSRHSL